MESDQHDSSHSSSEQIGVTVVVPTLDRAQVLADCLRDLAAQDYQSLEILIVDQSSEPNSLVLDFAAQSSTSITYRHVAFRSLPQARNYGWQHAKYDAILFVDDDIRCGPELVSQHVQSLLLPRVGVVAGGIEEAWRRSNPPLLPTGMFDRWTATAQRGFESFHRQDVDHAPGGNFSVWRHVLHEVGGFDETLGAGAALGEETEFCLRVHKSSYRIVFNGQARLLHLATASGGCRVPDIERYVWALTRNRSLVIRRHLERREQPIALVNLACLAASYVASSRNSKAILSGVKGAWEGWQLGGSRPRCTSFPRGRLGE